MRPLPLITAVLTTAALTAPVHAEVTERGEGRTGAMFSVGLGGGHLGCDNDGEDCSGDGPVQAGSFFGEVGAMVAPGLAVLGHLAVTAHRDDDVTVSQTMLAGALRAWLVPRLWVEGGLGVARAKVDVDGEVIDLMSESDTVPAVLAGVGVELISTDAFALDVNLRAGSGLYRDDVRLYQASLGVGASFF
ncbi:MAG: hypothetical protein R2939_02870 [Kofleriaceae bacterium]